MYNFTREEAQEIVKHYDLIEHFAKGGEVEHHTKNYKGEFTAWETVGRLFIAGLNDMRKKEGANEH